jgi:hypothetical protein
MTKFNRKEFKVDCGGYVHYQGVFVARFKYMKGNARSFISFLVKNFSVEEYFTYRGLGFSPVEIAEHKGFILAHIKRWLKSGGYPLTREGYAQWRKDNEKYRINVLNSLAKEGIAIQ